MTKNEQWILSEWRVACDRVSNFNETLIGHREKTAFAEVDLIFAPRIRSKPIVIVEVKSWNTEIFGSLWGPMLISKKQIARLERARHSIEARTSRETKLVIAVVSQLHKGAPVSYFEAPFS